jgi:hypothetical protein
MLDYESGLEDRKILTFKVNFLCQKSSESFYFFSLKNIKSVAQLILMTLFDYCHFWNTLFTKIRQKFQILIPNWTLICQRSFKLGKCLFPFNESRVCCGSCWKIPKWYLVYMLHLIILLLLNCTEMTPRIFSLLFSWVWPVWKEIERSKSDALPWNQIKLVFTHLCQQGLLGTAGPFGFCC